MKPALTLDDAKKLMAAAEEEAIRNKWEVVIAILNDGGRIVAVHRMDGARPGNDQIRDRQGDHLGDDLPPERGVGEMDRRTAQGLCDVSVHCGAGRVADHHRRRPDRRHRGLRACARRKTSRSRWRRSGRCSRRRRPRAPARRND
jgi:hypothetical protein